MCVSVVCECVCEWVTKFVFNTSKHCHAYSGYKKLKTITRAYKANNKYFNGIVS